MRWAGGWVGGGWEGERETLPNATLSHTSVSRFGLAVRR